MMAVPQAISNLQLRRAFRGYAAELMDCVETRSDAVVYVIDDNDRGISCFAGAEAAVSGCFIGLNPANHELHLLSIDNGLFKSPEGGVADCALIHADLFAFVEFKSNAEGKTQDSVTYTYEKAISQLEHTLEMFNAKLADIGLDFRKAVEVVCHIIVSPIFPRQSAMEMNYCMRFAIDNGVQLSFDNQRIFSHTDNQNHTERTMTNENLMTAAEAQQWVESREWANGWSVNADKSIDALEFANQYHRNKALWDKLFKFLAETDPMTLEAGKKIVLEEGRLWINVLEYTPKSAEETNIESHRNFIDLQYTYEGNELMGLAGKVTPINEYDPVKDRTNYSTDEEIVYSPAPADRFFLYFPKDMHQPSVRSVENPGISRKLVGKIEYAK